MAGLEASAVPFDEARTTPLASTKKLRMPVTFCVTGTPVALKVFVVPVTVKLYPCLRPVPRKLSI